MSKVLLIGDIHLKMASFQTGLSFIKWCGEVVASNEIDIVMTMGDFFDGHSVIRSEVLGEFKNYVSIFKDIKYHYYICGNHDYFKPNDNKYHALLPFKNSDVNNNLIIVDSPMHFDNISIIPYIPKEEDFPKITKQYCFCHQTFKGAVFDQGMPAPDGVDPDSIVGVDFIISGHIHRAQTYGKVKYVGSPYAQNANDINQEKGIYIWDTEKHCGKFIESPMPKWRKYSFKLNDILANDTVLHNINKKDNYIIELEGNRAELLSYINSKSYKSLTEDKKVTTKPVFIDKDKKQVKIEADNSKDLVTNYINKIYNGSLDKEVILSKLNELWEV